MQSSKRSRTRVSTAADPGASAGSYYPIDVAFWAHRDILKRLTAALSEEDRVSLLAQMDAVLSDMVSEEAIEESQVGRFETRQVELADLRKTTQSVRRSPSGCARRETTRLSASCSGTRPSTRRARSFRRWPPREALDRLEAYGPPAFASDEATRLMHRLWTVANLPPNDPDGRDSDPCSLFAVGVGTVAPDPRRPPPVPRQRVQPVPSLLPRVDASGTRGVPLSHRRAARNGACNDGQRRRVGALAVVTQEDDRPRCFEDCAPARCGRDDRILSHASDGDTLPSLLSVRGRRAEGRRGARLLSRV